MGITLNDTSYKTAVGIMSIVAAFAVMVMCFFEVAFAAGGGTFIGKGANSLLSDFAVVIALAGVGVGIFQIIKGRMVMGIVVMLVAAIIYAFCASPTLFGTFGNNIVNIFQ